MANDPTDRDILDYSGKLFEEAAHNYAVTAGERGLRSVGEKTSDLNRDLNKEALEFTKRLHQLEEALGALTPDQYKVYALTRDVITQGMKVGERQEELRAYAGVAGINTDTLDGLRNSTAATHGGDLFNGMKIRSFQNDWFREQIVGRAMNNVFAERHNRDVSNISTAAENIRVTEVTTIRDRQKQIKDIETRIANYEGGDQGQIREARENIENLNKKNASDFKKLFEDQVVHGVRSRGANTVWDTLTNAATVGTQRSPVLVAAETAAAAAVAAAAAAEEQRRQQVARTEQQNQERAARAEQDRQQRETAAAQQRQQQEAAAAAAAASPAPAGGAGAPPPAPDSSPPPAGAAPSPGGAALSPAGAASPPAAVVPPVELPPEIPPATLHSVDYSEVFKGLVARQEGGEKLSVQAILNTLGEAHIGLRDAANNPHGYDAAEAFPAIQEFLKTNYAAENPQISDPGYEIKIDPTDEKQVRSLQQLVIAAHLYAHEHGDEDEMTDVLETAKKDPASQEAKDIAGLENITKTALGLREQIAAAEDEVARAGNETTPKDQNADSNNTLEQLAQMAKLALPAAIGIGTIAYSRVPTLDRLAKKRLKFEAEMEEIHKEQQKIRDMEDLLMQQRLAETSERETASKLPGYDDADKKAARDAKDAGFSETEKEINDRKSKLAVRETKAEKLAKNLRAYEERAINRDITRKGAAERIAIEKARLDQAEENLRTRKEKLETERTAKADTDLTPEEKIARRAEENAIKFEEDKLGRERDFHNRRSEAYDKHTGATRAAAGDDAVKPVTPVEPVKTGGLTADDRVTLRERIAHEAMMDSGALRAEIEAREVELRHESKLDIADRGDGKVRSREGHDAYLKQKNEELDQLKLQLREREQAFSETRWAEAEGLNVGDEDGKKIIADTAEEFKALRAETDELQRTYEYETIRDLADDTYGRSPDGHKAYLAELKTELDAKNKTYNESVQRRISERAVEIETARSRAAAEDILRRAASEPDRLGRIEPTLGPEVHTPESLHDEGKALDKRLTDYTTARDALSADEAQLARDKASGTGSDIADREAKLAERSRVLNETLDQYQRDTFAHDQKRKQTHSGLTDQRVALDERQRLLVEERTKFIAHRDVTAPTATPEQKILLEVEAEKFRATQNDINTQRLRIDGDHALLEGRVSLLTDRPGYTPPAPEPELSKFGALREKFATARAEHPARAPWSAPHGTAGADDFIRSMRGTKVGSGISFGMGAVSLFNTVARLTTEEGRREYRDNMGASLTREGTTLLGMGADYYEAKLMHDGVKAALVMKNASQAEMAALRMMTTGGRVLGAADEAESLLLGASSTLSKVKGFKLGVPIAIVASGASAGVEYYIGKRQLDAGRTAGAMGSAAGGIVGFAVAGAAVGSGFLGVGAIPGALIGIGAGIAGSYFGEKIGRDNFTGYYEGKFGIDDILTKAKGDGFDGELTRQLDTNHDDVVSLSEIKQGLAKQNINALRYVDTDNDGNITRTELSKALREGVKYDIVGLDNSQDRARAQFSQFAPPGQDARHHVAVGGFGSFDAKTDTTRWDPTKKA